MESTQENHCSINYQIPWIQKDKQIPQTDGLCWRSAPADLHPWARLSGHVRPQQHCTRVMTRVYMQTSTHVQCYRQGNKTEVEREREITIVYKEKVPQTMFSVQASMLHNINTVTCRRTNGWRAEDVQPRPAVGAPSRLSAIQGRSPNSHLP